MLPHPPYDEAPEADTLGLRHVEVALDDLEFPMTTAQLRARAGNWRIPVTGAVFERLGDMLEGVDDEKFRSPREVARAIGRAHPELKG